MNLADALPPDELTLAQLTASKLAKIMHGLMSVGTASLGLEASKDFLADRGKTPLGFLEVLWCIGVKPGHWDKIPLLRERVQELKDVTGQFHRLFVQLTDWRNLPADEIKATVELLGESYTLFCQRLGAFCSLLGVEADFSQQAIQDRNYLVAFFQTVCHPDSEHRVGQAS